ncbi:MAG: hypothetical protein KC476_09700, partial [Cyanobacteria bacterium HKST-UBA06]|nr:hypothetical protein [Cyanobacteria bacterium HKST-UBA06]
MLVIHKLVAKRIAASIAIGLYTVAMIQNSWADFTLNTTSVKTGTAASPYVINDNNLIHIQGNGYLRVINGDGSNGGHVQLNAPNGLIIIDNGGTVDASAQSLGGSGGSVQINGGTVVNNGRIWANGSGSGPGGQIFVNAGTFSQGATGDMSAYGGSQSAGLGGAIRVSASDTITVDGKMRTSGRTGTNPTYNGAANQISLIGNGVTIASSANLGALGGGSLTISSRNGITQNGTISVEGSGTTSGGFLTMNATSGNIDLNGLTTARGYQSSNGGHIVALANRGTVSVGSTGRLDANGGTNTSSSSVGRAGSVTLQGHHVSLTGNGTDVNVTANGGQSTLTGQAGQAGTITLQATAGDVTMTNAKLVASGRHGGNIDIEATGQIRLQGNGYVAANAANGQVGNGGTITLDASDIAITAHGAYETLVAEGTQNPLNAAGQGNGGSISLTASRTIDIDSTADNAGVKTAVMSVRGSNSDQAGNGGRIYLKAGTTLSFDEHQADAQFKRLLANANGGQAHQGNNGGGGLIQMSAGSMALNRAKLDASAGFNQTGTIADLAGDAGTVALRTADALALVNTTVTANASGSAGGGGQLLLESTHGDIVLTNTFAGLLSNAQSHLDVATGGNITQFGGELYARGVGIAGHGGNVTLAFGN